MCPEEKINEQPQPLTDEQLNKVAGGNCGGDRMTCPHCGKQLKREEIIGRVCPHCKQPVL